MTIIVVTGGASPTESAKGYVNHGADNSVARPVGYVSVEWVGSVEPTNMRDNDTWLQT